MQQSQIQCFKVYGNAKGLFRLVINISAEVAPKSKKLTQCVSYVQARSVSDCSNRSLDEVKLISIDKFCEWAKHKFSC